MPLIAHQNTGRQHHTPDYTSVWVHGEASGKSGQKLRSCGRCGGEELPIFSWKEHFHNLQLPSWRFSSPFLMWVQQVWFGQRCTSYAGTSPSFFP